MTDDEVVAAVQALVAAGEDLDELPAAPLVQVQLPEGRRWFGRGYRRGSPQHLAARAAGGVVRLPPLAPASQDAVTQAEQLVGHRLPRLLRRLYLEVGDGGFGPGYGILGVRGGHRDEGHRSAVDLFPWSWSPSAPPAAAAVLLPVCYWGCGIYSLVDCADRDAGMWGWDPNPAPDHDNGVALFAQGDDLRRVAGAVGRRAAVPAGAGGGPGHRAVARRHRPGVCGMDGGVGILSCPVSPSS